MLKALGLLITVNNKKDLAMTILEKYAGEVVVAGILMMLSWNSYTTYQNALALREIGTSISIYGDTLLHLSSSLSTLDGEVRGIDRRVSAIENTRWKSQDHKEFKQWIQSELDKKADK